MAAFFLPSPSVQRWEEDLDGSMLYHCQGIDLEGVCLQNNLAIGAPLTKN